MKVQWLLASLLIELLSPIYANAQNTEPLIFNSISISDIDDNANFKTCGYQLRARLDEENWKTMLQLLIYKNKNNDLFVSAGLAERSTITSEWVPKDNVAQWVKIGIAEPLVMNPYSLITIPEKGTSIFSLKEKAPSINLFNEIERQDSSLWIRIFDKEDNEERTYSGIIKTDSNSINMTKQCFKNLYEAE